MSSKLKIKSSDFICCVCGNTNTLQRVVSKQYPMYSERFVWCGSCKKYTKNIEVQSADILNKKLEFIGPETPAETKVYQILKNKKRI